MKKLIILSSMIISGAAYACPDFSGKYSVSNRPGDLYYVYQQQGCEKIVAKYCIGSDEDCGSFQIWIDGKYRSVGNTDSPCTQFDCRSFSWKGSTLAVNQKADWTFSRAFPENWNVECSSHDEEWSIDSNHSLLITKKNVMCVNGFKGDLITSRMMRL